MSTRAQRAANRRNAQASTGPLTDAGKQTSSHNAQTHGCSASPEFSILQNEDPNDFTALIERIRVEMQPATEHEGFLVGLMAQARWKRGRIQFHEMELLDQLIAGEPVESKIALMMRYAAHAERAYYKAHREYVQSRRQRENSEEAATTAAFEKWMTAPIGQAPLPQPKFLYQPAPQPDSASFGKTETALRI